jgi:HK97 family phage prohead protease
MKSDILDFGFEVKADDVTPEGLFKGIASTFNNVDSGNDVVAPGAFVKTIAAGGRNGNGVAMLWQHELPLGVWQKMEERKQGLLVEGQIAVETTLGKDAHILMKMGAVRGLSIGFNARVFEIDQQKKVRVLKEVDLWEISVVTFPMNKRANVLGIKQIEGAQTVRQLEDALRDAGLTCKAARYVSGLCKTALRDVAEEGQSVDDVLKTLRSANKDIESLVVDNKRF